MQTVSDQGGDSEVSGAGQNVEHEMVTSGEHGQRGGHGIQPHQVSPPPSWEHPPQRQCRPAGPPDVQRGHGRQLVGRRRQRPAVPGSERMGASHHVQVHRRVIQTRWGGGDEPVDHHAEDVQQDQTVPQRPVAVRPLPPQDGHQSQGDHEVGVVVVVRDPDGQCVVMAHPVVHGRLGVHVHPLLGVEEGSGVLTPQTVTERGQIGDHVVHPAQPHDHDQLDP